MDIRDFKKQQERSKLIQIKTFYGLYDINNLSINDDKKELLHSIPSYINNDVYISAEYLYKNYIYPIHERSYLQCLHDGKRYLVSIKLCKNYDDNYNSPKVVSQKEFDKYFDMYQLIGSQEYYFIKLHNMEDLPDTSIFFTKDGNVFLNKFEETAINHRDINKLGDELLRNCDYLNNSGGIKKFYIKLERPNYR